MTRRKLLRALTVTTCLMLLLAGTFIANLYWSQESIIFPATRLPENHQFQFDVPFEERDIDVDGATLNALHFRQDNPRGLIFFLHGNGGNLESWTENAEYYRRVNYDLFIFDYRGYGKSSGRIESEQQLHNDVRIAWDSVAGDYPDKPIIVYGRSLGAALAAKLASDVNSDLLILVSPFTSMVAMAQREYPFLPSWLVRYPFRSDEIVPLLRVPTIFVHGDRDRLIPLSHSLCLMEQMASASQTPVFLRIEGAGHNDIHRFDSYLNGLTNRLLDKKARE